MYMSEELYYIDKGLYYNYIYMDKYTELYK